MMNITIIIIDEVLYDQEDLDQLGIKQLENLMFRASVSNSYIELDYLIDLINKRYQDEYYNAHIGNSFISVS